ncbi:hypothetical protein NKG94_23995 [Micromonospora sp. M12]
MLPADSATSHAARSGLIQITVTGVLWAPPAWPCNSCARAPGSAR